VPFPRSLLGTAKAVPFPRSLLGTAEAAPFAKLLLGAAEAVPFPRSLLGATEAAPFAKLLLGAAEGAPFPKLLLGTAEAAPFQNRYAAAKAMLFPKPTLRRLKPRFQSCAQQSHNYFSSCGLTIFSGEVCIMKSALAPSMLYWYGSW